MNDAFGRPRGARGEEYIKRIEGPALGGAPGRPGPRGRFAQGGEALKARPKRGVAQGQGRVQGRLQLRGRFPKGQGTPLVATAIAHEQCFGPQGRKAIEHGTRGEIGGAAREGSPQRRRGQGGNDRLGAVRGQGAKPVPGTEPAFCKLGGEGSHGVS